MSWTIIVASSDSYQLDALMDAAQQIAARMTPPGPRPVTALSVEDVRRRRTRSSRPATELLITAASLPVSQAEPLPQPEAGLDLIRSLAQEPEPPACILVSAKRAHYLAMQGFKRCEWLAVDDCTNYLDQCLLLAGKLGVLDAASAQPSVTPIGGESDGSAGLVPQVPSPPTAADPAPIFVPARTVAAQDDPTRALFALLEVDLEKDAKRAKVRLDYHYLGRIERGEDRWLDFKQRSLDELIKKSRALKDRMSKALAKPQQWERYVKRWRREYQALGKQMDALLWRSYFGHLYSEANVGTRGNVRLRFNLEQQVFDGLWEAMSDRDGREPLMVQQTITRRARCIGSNVLRAYDRSDDGDQDQIESHGRLNILVIKSNVPNGSSPIGPDDPLYRASFKGKLPRLPHLDDEVKVLREELTQQAAGPNGGGPALKIEVDVLEPPNAPPQGWSLAREVEACLKEPGRRYDIVHFAGHALFAPSASKQDGRGYLIFSGDGRPTAEPIATVAGWLNNAEVQLVYLSCCRSSAASPALEFARNDVPMTIGFSWDLDDSKAVDFARHFYGELLKNELKVCPAMRQARKNLFNHYNAGDPIWASPVLVAQPIDWIRVEGVLRPASHERRNLPRPLSSRVAQPAPHSPRARMSVLSAAQAPAAR